VQAAGGYYEGRRLAASARHSVRRRGPDPRMPRAVDIAFQSTLAMERALISAGAVSVRRLSTRGVRKACMRREQAGRAQGKI
jgi:hypothetical protein